MIILLLALIFQLEYAVTPQEKARGLQERESIATDEAMLFVYKSSAYRSVWSYRCLFDMTVAFLDANGYVIDVHYLKAYPDMQDPKFFHKNAAKSKVPARYFLEMHADWYGRIQLGDQLKWEYPKKEATLLKN